MGFFEKLAGNPLYGRSPNPGMFYTPAAIYQIAVFGTAFPY